MIGVCKLRIAELDELDREIFSPKFHDFGQAAKGLRNVHRTILTSSIEKFVDRSKNLTVQ